MEIPELKIKDKELFDCIEAEQTRQRDTLEMIASESIQSDTTLAIAGSVFNNKTAVGGVGHQRLGGSDVADRLERLAAERACDLFRADHANILPYSGSVANFCGYSSCLNPGDRIIALDPDVGSHQSHGGRNNISSRIYKFEYFGLNKDTLLIDYDEAEKVVKEFKPKLMVIGSASYSRDIDFERLADIAHRGGALLMTDIAHFSGLVAAGIGNSPVPFADIVTASTTKTLCGPHSGFIMCKNEFKEAVDKAVYPGNVASLHLQTIAAMAYAFERAKRPEFKELMQNVVKNAKYICKALEKRGFEIVTGGTDCHMFVCDLRPFGVEADKFADALERAGITSNTKKIPYDTHPTARGIRAGTTVLTQRGFKERELDIIADIYEMLAKTDCSDEAVLKATNTVKELVKQFPI